jgi:hypothetical protein
MKVRTFKAIENNKFSVSISAEDFSQDEEQKMNKFGEPEVNVGGLYGNENDHTSGFILPDNYEKLKAAFVSPGFKIAFDSRDYEDAEKRADSWSSKVKDRIQEAIEALRQKDDTFTEEVVHNI